MTSTETRLIAELRAEEGQAVYITAPAAGVPDDQLDAVASEAFRTTAGARKLTPRDLRDAPYRLYLARMQSCEVHVPGDHPAHGRGIDTRQPADATRG